MSFEDQCDLSRNLKGAAASILLALLLSGRSLTAAQLEVATSYSDKPIRKALSWLEPRRFVQHNGHNNGWSLGPAAIKTFKPVLSRLLQTQPRPTAAARSHRSRPDEFNPSSPGGPNGLAPNLISNRNTRVQYQVTPQVHTLTDRNNSEHPPSKPRKNSEHAHSQTRKNSDIANQPRKISGHSSENLRSSATTDQISSDPESDLSDDLIKTSADHQIPDLVQENRNTSELARFLLFLKIREPAFTRILDTCDTPLVLAWWWQAVDQKWLDNHIGWLICRLDNQEEPPAAYLELARAWLALDDNEKSEMRSASYLYGGLESYWQNRDLSRTAVRILSPIHRSGGFKIFDEND